MSQDSTFPALPWAMLFEKAPHVTVLLDPSLAILVVNEAAQRFLGMDATHLTGLPLFDVLPNAADTGTGWQDRLQRSYAQVLATGEQVTLLLPAHDGPAAVAEPAQAQTAAPSTGGAIWHVCHAPMRDDAGTLIAIATYAIQLEGIEIAIAQLSGFATTQMAAVRAASAAPGMTPTPGLPSEAATAASAAVMPVRLPDAATPAAVAQTGADASDGLTAPGFQRDGGEPASTGMRILMVEDNEELRTINVDQLELLGHQVTSTADAEQALRHLETSTFDLLFTDLTLPKMTGAELARLVLQQHHPMRVVITSGYGRAMANAQSLDALFLPKPYRFADLKEVLRQVRLRNES